MKKLSDLFKGGKVFEFGHHRVKIKQALGEGGFSHVFVVRDVASGELFAMKRMLAPNNETMQLALTEIQVMEQLQNHPNIVRFLGKDILRSPQGAEIYILMEYCTGGHLVDIMRQRAQNRFSETEVLQIFFQVCLAVQHMHGQKLAVCHRDLKVENVLLSADGVYKLCDFGSCTTRAKVYETQAEIVREDENVQRYTTLAYRPPEMVDLYSKQLVNEKVDIWALGVLLYKLCFYTTPFEEKGALAILNANYKIPTWPPYSHALHALIKFMLVPRPAERPNIDDVLERVAKMRGVPPPRRVMPAGSGSSAASGAPPSRKVKKRPSIKPDSKAPMPTVSAPLTPANDKRGLLGGRAEKKKKKASSSSDLASAGAYASSSSSSVSVSTPGAAANASLFKKLGDVPTLAPPPESPRTPRSRSRMSPRNSVDAGGSGGGGAPLARQFSDDGMFSFNQAMQQERGEQRALSDGDKKQYRGEHVALSPKGKRSAHHRPPGPVAAVHPAPQQQAQLMRQVRERPHEHEQGQAQAGKPAQPAVDLKVNTRLYGVLSWVEDNKHDGGMSSGGEGDDDDDDDDELDDGGAARVPPSRYAFPSIVATRDQVHTWMRKATRPDAELPPKRKHVSHLIVETWESGDKSVFLPVLMKRPLRTNAVVCFKSMTVLHQVLQQGSMHVLREACKYVRVFESLQEWWKVQRHIAPDFSPLVVLYVQLVLAKINFHHQHPAFEGNMSIETYLLHRNQRGFSMASPFRIEVVSRLLDLLAHVASIVRHIFTNTSFFNCKSGCLVPLIREAYALYLDAMCCLNELALGGKHIDNAVLARFSTIHTELTDIFDVAVQLDCVTRFIPVPYLDATLPSWSDAAALPIAQSPPSFLPSTVRARAAMQAAREGGKPRAKDSPSVSRQSSDELAPPPVAVSVSPTSTTSSVSPASGFGSSEEESSSGGGGGGGASGERRTSTPFDTPPRDEPAVDPRPAVHLRVPNSGSRQRPRSLNLDSQGHMRAMLNEAQGGSGRRGSGGMAQLTPQLQPSSTQRRRDSFNPFDSGDGFGNIESELGGSAAGAASAGGAHGGGAHGGGGGGNGGDGGGGGGFGASSNVWRSKTPKMAEWSIGASSPLAPPGATPRESRTVARAPGAPMTHPGASLAPVFPHTPFDTPPEEKAPTGTGPPAGAAVDGGVGSGATGAAAATGPGAAAGAAAGGKKDGGEEADPFAAADPFGTADPFGGAADPFGGPVADAANPFSSTFADGAADGSDGSTGAPVAAAASAASAAPAAMPPPGSGEASPAGGAEHAGDDEANPFGVVDESNPFSSAYDAATTDDDGTWKSGFPIASPEPVSDETLASSMQQQLDLNELPRQLTSMEGEIDASELQTAERIGIGGFGEVLRGTWRGTPVAIKKLVCPQLTDALLGEFRREVRVMQKLRHPNVVLYMGACTVPPNLCIVTEFLSRGNLFEVLHSNLEINLGLVLKMATDAAMGMLYLHSFQPPILHRDLKSFNLLVDNNFNVKVADFGLAKVRSYASKMTGKVGTVHWAAPEVLRNEQYTEKADVYSFGIVLWEMITRQEPYKGLNPMQVGLAVLNEGVRPTLPPNCPPPLARLIQSCWSDTPDERPTFVDILEQLAQLRELTSRKKR